MRELQAKIIEEMGVQPRIDPAGEVRKRVTFLKEYLKATGDLRQHTGNHEFGGTESEGGQKQGDEGQGHDA